MAVVGDDDVHSSLLGPKMLTAEEETAAKRRAVVNRIGAMIMIVLCVAIWVAMAELLQHVERNGSGTPYFMTYFIHVGYSLFGLIYVCMRLWDQRKARKRALLPPPYQPIQVDDIASDENTRQVDPNPDREWGPWMTKRTLVLTFFYNLLCLGISMTWYVSLPRTSVSANTGIYNSSCVFVYLLAIPILKEKLVLNKVIAVCVCVAGVFLIAFSPPPEQPASGSNGDALGYAMVVLSTIGYALYEVLFQRFVVQPELREGVPPDRLMQTADTCRFLGAIGVWNTILLWPFFFMLNSTGIEVWNPPTGSALTDFAIVVVIDSCYQIFLFIGIFLSSPLFMAIGTMLTIPASVVADHFLHHFSLPARAMGGLGLVIVGFLMLNFFEWWDMRKEARHKMQPKKE